MAEVCPIDLRLFARCVELQERFAVHGPQSRNGTAQLRDAAGITAVANHLINACGAQARVLIQRLAYEPGIKIDQGCAHRPRILESLGLAVKQSRGRYNAIRDIRNVLTRHLCDFYGDRLIERHITQHGFGVGDCRAEIIESGGGIRPFSMR